MLIPTRTSPRRPSASTFPGENGVVGDVVGPGSEDGAVGLGGDGGESGTALVLEPSHEFGDEVLGVGGAATVAAHQQLAAAPEAGDDEVGRPHDLRPQARRDCPSVCTASAKPFSTMASSSAARRDQASPALIAS